ncbi:MAG: hypothetical protein HYT61_00995 [Candidatus Yanofskybacteria bacterium]|nr:hypothetical protein [Candidatus Yanofskybacteria bacterium]
MKSGDDLVKTFANCFRLLAKISMSIEDSFFGNLLQDCSQSLLTEYVKFLKAGNGAHVAQYGSALIFQIGSITGILEIIKHLKLIDQITPLLLELELLELKLLLLNFRKTTSSGGDVNTNNDLAANTKKKNIKKITKSLELSELHKQIADFIKSENRSQNLEIFSKFDFISRRTLKRKLSELVGAGAIKRIGLGKKVFYTAPADSIK